MGTNLKGHAEIRNASGGQFKVYTVGSNGEIVKVSERLTSHDACITNIKSDLDTYNGTHVKVRDYVNKADGEGEGAEYSEYVINADLGAKIPDINVGHNDPPKQPL